MKRVRVCAACDGTTWNMHGEPCEDCAYGFWVITTEGEQEGQADDDDNDDD